MHAITLDVRRLNSSIFFLGRSPRIASHCAAKVETTSENELLACVKLVVEAAHLFEPSAGGGATGSLPGSSAAPLGKNPFKRGPEWNITEQMKVIKRDPKLAERLKAAA